MEVLVVIGDVNELFGDVYELLGDVKELTGEVIELRGEVIGEVNEARGDVIDARGEVIEDAAAVPRCGVRFGVFSWLRVSSTITSSRTSLYWSRLYREV